MNLAPKGREPWKEHTVIVIGDDGESVKSGLRQSKIQLGKIKLRAKARSSALVPEVRHTRLEARRFAVS